MKYFIMFLWYNNILFKIILFFDHELANDENIMIFIFEQQHIQNHKKSKTKKSHYLKRKILHVCFLIVYSERFFWCFYIAFHSKRMRQYQFLVFFLNILIVYLSATTIYFQNEWKIFFSFMYNNFLKYLKTLNLLYQSLLDGYNSMLIKILMNIWLYYET
jgi:hypothetical protein